MQKKQQRLPLPKIVVRLNHGAIQLAKLCDSPVDRSLDIQNQKIFQLGKAGV